MSSSNKKAKKAPEGGYGSESEQIALLRAHMRSFPGGVNPDGRAARAVCDALDKESARIDRDERLRKKFAAATSSSPSGAESAGDRDLMEWQDVSVSPAKAGDGDGGGSNPPADGGSTHIDPEVIPPLSPPPHEEASALGRDLASHSISAMAAAGTKVSTPLAAVALALHSALLSDLLGFRCTGVPDDGKNKGFAAPIRELPKSKFIPDRWDRNSKDEEGGDGVVAIRYRKDGVGSSVLRAVLKGPDLSESEEALPQSMSSVRISFCLAGMTSDESEVEFLTFPLDKHVNLHGLSAALARERAAIPPALHYKALGKLMSDFSSKFDFGQIYDGTQVTTQDVITIASLTVITTTETGRAEIPSLKAAVMVPPDSSLPSLPYDRVRPMDPPLVNPPLGVPVGGVSGHIPRIDDLEPQRPRGDFAGDLAPAGLSDLRLGRSGGDMYGGNLMGPNHPSFRDGTFDIHHEDDRFIPSNPSLPGVGGPGMQPRFDLYYPPGVGEIGTGGPARGMARGRGRGRGRGRHPHSGGDPNPDHQRPPSDLGGNMFL